jgi:hypothetical protein
MKISVIIPLYNKAHSIRRTLDSVAAQTRADYEVIVVDDGSTDGGGALVAEGADPRVRLIVQKNAGPGAARNMGLGEAAGEYVAFLDADDEWLPRYLERSVALLEGHGPGVAAVSSGYFEHPSGRSMEPLWRRRGLADGPRRLDASTPALGAVYLLAYMSPWSTVARAAVVRRWGGFFAEFRCTYAEDSYLWLKVLLNETILINMEPLVRYHREDSDLSRSSHGPRPVEPMLTHTPGIEAACPPPLRALLAEVLAIRANKTACMLGYWGRWREAADLLAGFRPPSSRRLPRYWPARVCATPLGPMLGGAWRTLSGLTRRRSGPKRWTH